MKPPLVSLHGPAEAQKFDFTIDGETIPCGQYGPYQPIVWYGNDAEMTLSELAAYCAPVLWFSPDEPLLQERSGTDIDIPMAFPFEDSSAAPVVYWRVRTILERADAKESAYAAIDGDRPDSRIDLSRVSGIDLDFFFYYPSEAGLGGHKHDVEYAEMQAMVWRRDNCPESQYHLVIFKIIGKAHGLQWYDNTLRAAKRSWKFPTTPYLRSAHSWPSARKITPPNEPLQRTEARVTRFAKRLQALAAPWWRVI